MPDERQVTFAPHGHMLTNINVWSHCGQWIVYDVRTDPQGAVFDGWRIERVHARTGEIQILHHSKNGAHCGVATCNPAAGRVAFIEGPEYPTPEWTYAASRRRGLILHCTNPPRVQPLDARNLLPPFTAALRGGTHVHVFSGDGEWVSFTYEDHILESLKDARQGRDINQRNIGVSVPRGPVRVPPSHPRNHDGDFFSVIVTRTVSHPSPGSDEISRAFEDAWVGRDGYVRPDGTRQKRAIAFQGEVATARGSKQSEVFIVDIPDDVTLPGDRPLQGTETRRPFPPKGAVQRRLSFTAERKYPGLQGPRHWLRSSPDGARIAFLMKDDDGVVQVWTVSPNGGQPAQVTRNDWDIASAFSWSPDGRYLAHIMDNSVFATEIMTGRATRLTPRTNDDAAPRPEACVFSPDGLEIAYMRDVVGEKNHFNQIFVTQMGTPS